MTARIDLTGKTFGRWKVLSYFSNSKWTCVCECGFEKEIYGHSLRNGASTGCMKCNNSEGKSAKTHGGSKSRLYRCWEAMKRRCLVPACTRYMRYGGRGITIAKEWMDSFEAFKDWALKNGYENHLTIERINNDGNYEPNNCKWATRKEQTRNYSRNRPLIFNGKTVIAADLAAEAKLPAYIVRQRIHRYGWSIEKALTTPVKARSGSKKK